MLKIAAILVALPLALLALVAGTGVLVVDVQESGPDGHHLVVPVPLLLAQTAVALVPRGRAEVDLPPDFREHLLAAEKLIEALAAAPDGELVGVEDRQEQVRVAKVGDTLQVRVHGPREDVSVNVPLGMVTEILRHSRGDRIAAADLVGALREARLSDLVDVRDGDTHVKVWVW